MAFTIRRLERMLFFITFAGKLTKYGAKGSYC